MLDSSPVALPQIRKTLKRSASTASLPTPPRTHRKLARGRSRGSCDSDSDDHALPPTDDEEGGSRHKKRRTGDVGNADADADAFWFSGPSDAASASKADASKSQAAPLLYRKRQAQTAQADVALASPPPSHRKLAGTVVTPQKSPMSIDSSPARATSPPSTPKTRSASKRAALALRDSPDNPFLATPVEDSDTPGPSDSSANPSPSTPAYDKPYITYVFRGTRRTYQNPNYNHAEGRPLSPEPESKLPIDHPDYSPTMVCPPKLLFPQARHNKKGKKAAGAGPKTRGSKARGRSLSPSGHEVDDAVDILPKKLNFGDPEKKKTTVKSK